MTKSKRKRRRTKSGLEVHHKVHGCGQVVHKRITDHGDAMLIQFQDGSERVVLLEIDGASPWVDHEQAVAACDAAREGPRPKAPPQKPIFTLRSGDIGRELDEEPVEIATEQED